MSIFEQATKKALRFKGTKGNITTEDLWSLKLAELDAIYVALDDEIRSSSKSYITQARANTEASLKLEVVKRVIDVKIADEARVQNNAELKVKEQAILAEIEARKGKALTTASTEDLERQLAEIRAARAG